MIAIIDYGGGNLRSVTNTFTHLGADVETIDSPERLGTFEKVVLPGVGAFGAGMDRLRAAGFVEPIREVADAGTPLFGICIGLQYLFESSDEMGHHEGLGLLPGHVTRFPEEKLNGLSIPHMGWNRLNIQQSDNPLLRGIPDGSYVYFANSYYAQAEESGDVVATTDYGIDFPSIVGRGNIFGIQCHPEKSQNVGMRIIKNFIEMETA